MIFDLEPTYRDCSCCKMQRPLTDFVKKCSQCLGCRHKKWKAYVERIRNNPPKKWPNDRKKCRNCKKLKHISKFHKCTERTDHLDTRCTKCRRKLFAIASMEKRYNLTIEQYISLYKQQGKACCICKKAKDDTKKKRWKPLDVDHDHSTNEVRGLLCHRCNAALAGVEFFIKSGLLDSAVLYLSKNTHNGLSSEDLV